MSIYDNKEIKGYNPGAGEQAPQKYPYVGDAYRRYGEQPGWTYSPRDDKYYRDSASREGVDRYEEEAGLKEKAPKQAGLGSTIAPIAGTLGAIYVGKEVGQGMVDYAKDVYKGAFGGESANATNAAGAASATTPPTGSIPASAPTATNPGLLAASDPAFSAGSATAGSSGVQVISPGTPQPPGTTAIGSSADGGVIVAPDAQIGADGTLSQGASTDYGALAQGAGGALQLYNAYNMYKDGNNAGAGIMGAAGAANVASAAGANLGSYAVPGLNAVAGLYGGYQTAKYLSDAPNGGRRASTGAMGGAAAGAGVGGAIGSVIPGAGTAIGAGVGAIVGGLAGAVGGWTGSSKDKYQMIRDSARKGWKEAGIIDENYQGTLADGSKFDFGKDGKGQVEIDYADPVTGRAIGLGNVLAAGEGSYGRATDGLSKLYTGAMISNAGGNYEVAKQNALHLARQRGMNLGNLTDQYQTMLDAGQINQGQFDAYLNGARELFAGQPEANIPPGVSGGQQVKGAAPQGQSTVENPPQLQRSSTLSPGIGKDGKRLQNPGLLGAR